MIWRKSVLLVLLVLSAGMLVGPDGAAGQEGLISHWTFDDGAGAIAADSSGNGNDGTINGNPQWVVGQIDGALDFDGSGDYVNCGADPVFDLTDEMTVAAWFVLRDTVEWQTLIAKGDNAWRVAINGTARSMYFAWTGSGRNYQNVATTSQAGHGEWHHVCGVYSTQFGGRIYFDGVDEGVNADLAGIDVGTYAVYIGDNSQATGRYWDGMIDDVQIYNRALSAAEVVSIMAGLGAKELAVGPTPEDEADDVIREIVLEWTAGEYAATHDVYFGTVFDDVNDASRTNPMDVLLSQGQTGTTFDPPGRLDFGQTYYWRVDEVNAAPSNTIFKGDVWSFTAEPYTYAIEGIVATSNTTSVPDQGPENIVNGSGLNAAGQHSTGTTDMWVGSPVAGETPYVLFEFDRVYKLDEMRVWNYNMDFEIYLGFGVKAVTVEYSENGTDWSAPSDVVLNQGPGKNTYTYNTTVPLQGVAAKYVRLTIGSSYLSTTSHGLAEVQFMYIPAHAREPQPANGATDVAVGTTLSWRAGREAASHEVYLATDPNALVLNGTTTQNSYSPGALDLNATYYWQVNEVNTAEAISTWSSALWSFSTQRYIEIEGFESYDDDIDAGTTIWQAWVDGLEDGSNGGSMVGNDPSPFAEMTIVHGGAQSMPLFYENSSASAFSEADRTLAPAQNWTDHGIKTLSLWFYGASGNAGQLYVKINNTKVLYDGDAADIAGVKWHPWNIDLSTVGGNLTNVATLSIGVEGAGSGVVYIDDIRLYAEEGQKVTPTEPQATGLAAHYTFDEGTGMTVADSSGNGNTGTVVGTPAWVTGTLNGAMQFSGDDYVNCGNGASLQIQDAITITAWIKIASFTVTWETILAKGDDSYRMSRGPSDGDSMHFGCNGPTGDNLTASAIVTTDTWRHVAVVFDGAYKRIYIDGAEDARAESTGQINISTYDLYIGENSGATGRQLGGLVDDIRIYNRALSAGELAGMAGRTAPIHVPF